MLITQRQTKRLVVSAYILFAAILAFGLIISTQSMLSAKTPLSEHDVPGGKTFGRFQQLAQRVSKLEKEQAVAQINVADPVQLAQRLSMIQIEIQSGQRQHALGEIADFNQELDSRFSLLGSQLATSGSEVNAARAASLHPDEAIAAGQEIPILLYHHPPADFESQMDHLLLAGYTSIDLSQAAAGLSGKIQLPAKPVVITFDDGLGDQEAILPALQKRNLKATFYIINGGEASQWCIGANRHSNSCGESYLTWDQIRTIDRNPLFTVASHSLDHLELAKQPPEIQRIQINEGKRQLEAELGHSVQHFCYPYGSFNATTLELVHEAGFITATTTVPGTFQPANGLYTLKRIRDTYNLN